MTFYLLMIVGLIAVGAMYRASKAHEKLQELESRLARTERNQTSTT